MTSACQSAALFQTQSLLTGFGAVACPRAASPDDFAARLRILLPRRVRIPSGNRHRRHRPCARACRSCRASSQPLIRKPEWKSAPMREGLGVPHRNGLN